jgi:tetratricopeptide (TPR) repeat protein
MSTVKAQRVGMRSGNAVFLVAGAFLLVLSGGFALRGMSSSSPPAATIESEVVPLVATPTADEQPTLSAADLASARSAGLAHAQLGRDELALEQLVPVYRAHPEDDAVAYAIAEASLRKRDFKTAQTVLAALRAPNAPDALRLLGMLHEQAGKLTEALALYERAIPGLAQPLAAMERRARVLSWLARFDDASAAFAALVADPRADVSVRRRARVRMAELTAWKKDLDGALSELAGVLGEEPHHAEALLLQGQVREWQGRYPEAKQSYSTLLAADANHAEARLRLDKLLWVQ